MPPRKHNIPTKEEAEKIRRREAQVMAAAERIGEDD